MFWHCRKIGLVEGFRLMCCTSPELRSASSYGHVTAAKEFRSQCQILSLLLCKRKISKIWKIQAGAMRRRGGGQILFKVCFWHRCQIVGFNSEYDLCQKQAWRDRANGLPHHREDCRTFGWCIDISLGESGAHEAPYVSLLIRASRPGLGESPGARHIAATLETL